MVLQYRFLAEGFQFEWWRLIIAAAGAYLLGSICFSIIVARVLGGVDIRKEGSGNPGTTNALRALGVRAAALTFAGDFAKGSVAVLIGGALCGRAGMLTAAVAVALGHIFPAFHRLKGGKAVATTAGIMAILDLRVMAIAIGLFVLITVLTRFVSVGSLIAAFSLVIFGWIFRYDMWLIIVMGFLAAVILIRHKKNISKLFRGEENKISFKKKRAT